MKHAAKRGRPRLGHPEKDRGTPELIAKRQANLTIEPLDLCFKLEIISAEEHWAGIHLRWLYAVIFGVPTPSASDPASLGGKSLRSDNTAWLRDREREYAKAQGVLRQVKATPLVPEVCIFSHFPDFLRGVRSRKTFKPDKQSAVFKKGLEGLSELFGRWP